jgi:purine-binding chemotaxis protein CheW
LPSIERNKAEGIGVMENSLSAQGNAVSSLLFRVHTRLCALPVAQVMETMRPLPIEPFTGAPMGVKGVAVIRGVPVPVVELAALLGNASSIPTRFVTVRSGLNQVALAVDSVLGLYDISTTCLQQLPALLSAADNNAVTAIGTLDAELLLLLNAGRLVPDDALPARNFFGAAS